MVRNLHIIYAVLFKTFFFLGGGGDKKAGSFNKKGSYSDKKPDLLIKKGLIQSTKHKISLF